MCKSLFFFQIQADVYYAVGDLYLHSSFEGLEDKLDQLERLVLLKGLALALPGHLGGYFQYAMYHFSM